MIKAVLFDMDGTLVDSERLGRRSWLTAAAERGVGDVVDDALITSFVGITRDSALDRLTALLGSRAEAEALFCRHEELHRGMEKGELALLPGAREALVALRRRGVHLGLATSTRRANATARLQLPQIDLYGLFDTMTFGDEVAHGKPEPDIYLEAARRAGVEPEECAVVEDSPNGVRSGHAAGMRVYLVPDTVEPTEEILGKSSAVLTSLSELEEALAPHLATR